MVPIPCVGGGTLYVSPWDVGGTLYVPQSDVSYAASQYAAHQRIDKVIEELGERLARLIVCALDHPRETLLFLGGTAALVVWLWPEPQSPVISRKTRGTPKTASTSLRKSR